MTERERRAFPPPVDPKRRRARALGREQLHALLRRDAGQSPVELAEAWGRAAAANLRTDALRADAQRGAAELVEEIAVALRQIVAGRGR